MDSSRVPLTTHQRLLSLTGLSLRLVTAVVLLGALLAWGVPPAVAAGQTDLSGPPGSGQFGQSVTVLPNGNIVVTDPLYNEGVIADVGAVYLYDGATGALISTLKGSTANDQVGSDGVRALSNGNYVVVSSNWASFTGAVTWCSGATGCTGVVSSLNSLVGSAANDYAGSKGVWPLSNGNYVVVSPEWASFTGAVTWGNGTTGVSGPITTTNSLVGGAPSDQVGTGGVVALSNGNYVVVSPDWANGVVAGAGAVTWCLAAGCAGTVVSSTNSLVGSIADDQVGLGGVVPMGSGNYAVVSPDWANGATLKVGAVTWCPAAGCVGTVVSSTNSLVGSFADDQIGLGGVVPVGSGNYTVVSPDWANGATSAVGAVTWCPATGCTPGAVSLSNSLVGSAANDQVGYGGTVALSNGNYVVASPNWANAAGAVTWCPAAGCTPGVVSPSNSLVGSTPQDYVGTGGLFTGGVVPVGSGNYAVVSPNWANGATLKVGAVTWCPATGCTPGAVSLSNSLVGSAASDQVGLGGVTPLSNGNYVVVSSNWANGGATAAGAVTWCPAAGCAGTVVSSGNSLVGSTADDVVGTGDAVALSNGGYLVVSFNWADAAGAVTWCPPTGCAGAISSSNSLVGSAGNDQVGYGGVVALSNGNYVVASLNWANAAGAVTWGSATGVSGLITTTNSVLGSAAGGGSSMVFAYDAVHGQLVVGRPADNIVTLFKTLFNVYLPLIVR